MPTKIEKDAITGTETTGHEWDGIRELNTPLPKWWVYVFYATILWAIVYVILYPAIPGLSGATDGVLGWSMREEIRQEMAAARDERSGLIDRIEQASLEEIRSDPELLAIAEQGGAAAFAENCAGCHGTGGQGNPNYPVLADDAWIWGGTLQDIQQTIRYGVRSGHEQTRTGVMPAYGETGILDREQISDLTEYVLSLTGRSENAEAAERGGRLFAEQCVSCHGPDGAGNREFGAPPLNDQIWLYGGSRDAISRQIYNPRLGVMPPWEGRLSDATIKMLTVYVHSRGGGEE